MPSWKQYSALSPSEIAQVEGTPSFHRPRAVLCGQAAVMESSNDGGKSMTTGKSQNGILDMFLHWNRGTQTRWLNLFESQFPCLQK